MLSTITLSSEYDDLPLLTRLWLQSRLRDPRASGNKFLRICESRPVTLSNIAIALDFAWLLAPRCWSGFMGEHRELQALLVAYIGHLVVQGVAPAIQLWACGHLLDLTQRTLQSGRAASWRLALPLVVFIVGVRAYVERDRRKLYRIERRLVTYLGKHTQKTLLRLKLSKSLRHPEDQIHNDLIAEAEVFGGVTGTWNGGLAETVYTDMHQRVFHFTALISSIIAIVSQLVVTIHALQTEGSWLNHMAFVALFALPTLLEFWVPAATKPQRSRRKWQELEGKAHTLRQAAMKPEEVAIFGLKDWIIDQWEATTTSRDTIDLEMADSVNHQSLSTIMAAVHNLVWVLLATGVIRTSTSLATLTLIQAVITNLGSRIRLAAENAKYMMGHAIFFGTFCAALDAHSKLESADGTFDYAKRREGNGMRIELRNLTVNYGKDNTSPALSNVNLSIGPGETLAIVGFNGSGKTTLIKALLGLVAPSGGQVLINNIPLNDYKPATIYSRVSCILQSFAKYGFTLRQEVGLGKLSESFEDDAIHTAMNRGGGTAVADRVGLEALLAREERWWLDSGNKLDKEVGKEGKEEDDDDDDKEKNERWDASLTYLSGGEWQRIALARAFMRADTADLVVFDEPTSALDPLAEADLFNTLYSLSRRKDHRCTTIFISHGFSNVRRADKIAFLSKGTIIEYGTHDELMELGGKYHELFTLQRQGFDGGRQ